MRLIIFFTALLLVLSNCSFALSNISDCQYIDTPDYYVLNTTIGGRAAPSTSCIYIRTENVTIDCAGYDIINDDASASTGIYIYNASNYLRNISIINCDISNYTTGVYTWSGTHIDNLTIRDNTVHNISSVGMVLTNGNSFSVLDNNVYDVTRIGIQMSCSINCNGTIVAGNNVTNCSDHTGYYGAIEADGVYTGMIIENNTVFDNHDIGIMVTTPQLSQGQHLYTVFRNNRVFNNYDGVVLNNGLYMTFSDSEIFNNSDMGINLFFRDILVSDAPISYSNFSNNTLYNNNFSIHHNYETTSPTDFYNQWDRNNTIDGNPVYYYYQGSTLDGYTGNPASNAGAIAFVYSDNFAVQNFDMAGLHTSNGISIVHSDNITIANVNMSYNYRRGLAGHNASNVAVDNVRITDNTQYTYGGSAGMYFNDPTNVSIYDSYCDQSGEYGIYMGGNGYTNDIVNIESYNHDRDGVYLGGVYDTYVNNVTVADNDQNGFHFGGYRTIASDILAFDNFASGIELTTENSTIDDVTTYGNIHGANCIAGSFSGSENNVVSNITAYNNYYGLSYTYTTGLIDIGTNNTYMDGSAYNNNYGAYVSGAHNEIFRNLDIHDNINASVRLYPHQVLFPPAVASSTNITFDNVAFRNSVRGAEIIQLSDEGGGPAYFNNCTFSGHADVDLYVERNYTVYLSGTFLQNANISMDLSGFHGNITFNGTDTAPALGGYTTIGNKYVEITNLSAAAEVVNVTFHYTDADISGIAENDLYIMEYDEGSWAEAPNQTRVPAQNQIYLENLQDFSTFGLFGILQNVTNVDIQKLDQTALQPSPGGIVEFNITITNNGNLTLDPVEVVDVLPVGLTFAGSSTAPDSQVGQTLTWNNAGPLSSNTSTEILLNATVDAGVVDAGNPVEDLTNYVNTTATPSQGPNETAEDYANVTVYHTNVSVLKTASDYSPVLHSMVNFTINVTNDGQTDLTLSVVDVLPPNQEFGTANPDPTSVVGQTLYWNSFSTIAPGNSAIINYTVAVNETGDGTNNVTVYAEPPNGDNVTDIDSVTLTVFAPPSDGGPAPDRELETMSVGVAEECPGDVIIVTVLDGDIPVDGADVELWMYEPLFEMLDSGTTDSEGQVRFESLPQSARYRIYASAGGYEDEVYTFDYLLCPVPGCVADADCPEEEICVDGECVPVSCPCGRIEDHRCIEYACCADDDCAEGMVCEDHVCRTPFECSSDSDCGDSDECRMEDGGGFCERIIGCGDVLNHTLIPWECGDELECPECPEGSICIAHECISGELRGPDEGFVGDELGISATANGDACRNCTVVIIFPTGENITDRTDEFGNIMMELPREGSYRILLLRNGELVASKDVGALIRPVGPEEQPQMTLLDLLQQFLPILLLLLLILAILILYWRRRGKKKRPRLERWAKRGEAAE